jgi:hypothetical protein
MSPRAFGVGFELLQIAERRLRRRIAPVEHRVDGDPNTGLGDDAARTRRSVA